jgi:Ricin-type beta-trefoil lectin domain
LSFDIRVYNKSDLLGYTALGYNSDGTFTDYPCGASSGTPHIHIKFLAKNINIDGSNVNWNTDNANNPISGIGFAVNSTYTSQNSATPIITDPNITKVIPLQINYNKSLDEGCQTGDGSRVYIFDRTPGDTNNCQRMRYNSGNYTITNPFGKCMDGGDLYSSNNRWLRFSTCNNGNNQKWLQDGNGRIWSFQVNKYNKVMCLEYTGTNNFDGVNVNPCNGNQSQKFWFDIGITGQSIPTLANVWQFQQSGTSQCLNGHSTNVDSWLCDQNDVEQLWENYGLGFRRIGSPNLCLNASNPSNLKQVTMISCTANNNNADQQWPWNSSNKLLTRNLSNPAQCLNSHIYTGMGSGRPTNTYVCSGSDPDLRWDAVLRS